MRVFAYCMASMADLTRRAAGVEPLTCPPYNTEQLFRPSLMEGNDLIYFDLHGEPGGSRWLGDGGVVAITAAQIRECDLRQTVVFAVNCYLADQVSPMLDALLSAGAQYVIAAPGENYTLGHTVTGAAELGLWFRRWLYRVEPLKALALAKHSLRVSKTVARLARRRQAEHVARDTLEFRAFYRT